MTTGRIAVGERDSRTRLPMLQASNLSPHYYTAREWYDREVDRIFLKEWQCVGRVEQVERPGDYFTTEIVGEPVLIVRDGDGEVRALSGVCRHRAQVIASGAGHVRNFQCPYHGWTYSLTGDLIGAPGMREAEGFDRRAHCLPSLPVEIWEGFIFINFDPGCEPLAPAGQAFRWPRAGPEGLHGWPGGVSPEHRP